MPSQPTPYRDSSADHGRSVPRHDRAEAASKLLDFDAAQRRGLSQRAAAQEVGVPRGTARHWSGRCRGLDLPDPVAAFLETPAGLAWLHPLVLAAVFVMTLRGPEGIRLVCIRVRIAAA